MSSENHDRLLEGAIAAELLRAVLARPEVETLLSGEHFTIAGTLVQACTSTTIFRPADGGGEPPAPGRNSARDFHGEQWAR